MDTEVINTLQNDYKSIRKQSNPNNLKDVKKDNKNI